VSRVKIVVAADVVLMTTTRMKFRLRLCREMHQGLSRPGIAAMYQSFNMTHLTCPRVMSRPVACLSNVHMITRTLSRC
jgi:hypothetical protein